MEDGNAQTYHTCILGDLYVAVSEYLYILFVVFVLANVGISHRPSAIQFHSLFIPHFVVDFGGRVNLLKAFEMIRAESQRLRVGLVDVVHRKCERNYDGSEKP